MAEAELAHQEKTVLDGFVRANRFGIGGHDFSDFGCSGHASGSDYAVHHVALGEDADDLSVAQHGQSTYAMFHHEAGCFEDAAVGVNGVDSAVFHDIVNLRHN